MEPGRRILVFDVNETMLDIGALAPHFARAFGDEAALREWFSTVLLYANVTTLAGPYRDFGAIGGAALEMVASVRGVALAPDDRDAILGGMRALPAHEDVAAGLTLLRDHGFHLMTLTNSAPAVVDAQLAHAGLSSYFERTFSIDAVKRFKPAPEAYLYVARELGVEPRRLRLVAAHAWDIAGAMQAGYAAAFIAREGKVLYPLAPAPDIIAADVVAAAKLIIAAETRH